MNRLVNEFGDKSLGVFLYASALGRQFSYEHADWQNGAFTKALLEGLAGKADIPVREHVLKRDDLGRVSELFLTGTTSEVLPVVRVDGQPVGDGKPGPVARRLQAAYADAVREFVSAG